MKKKSIAVDMDGVIAQTSLRALEWYERDFGVKLTLNDMIGKHWNEFIPEEHQKTVWNYPRQKGYFADLPVMPHSKKIMRALHEKYELFITTAATQFPESYNDKQNWLAKHFPFIDWKHTVFCGKKSIIHADYMIDDFAYNLEDFSGEGFLFTAFHNMAEERFTRFDNWLEVGHHFLGL